MNKYLSILAAIALTTVAACSETEDKKANIVQMTQKTESQKGVSKMAAEVKAKNGYMDFSADKYAMLRSKQEPFALFFHSKTCGTCRGKDAELKEMNLSLDMPVLKVEFSESPASLRKETGVTSYDTFVVFSEGGAMQKMVGASVPEVLAKLDGMTQNGQEGLYTAFSEGKYNQLRDSKTPFALFFHNETCGTCRGKDEVLSNLDLPAGTTVLKLEFNQSPLELRKELGVISYDTFVVFNEAGIAKKMQGAEVSEVVSAL